MLPDSELSKGEVIQVAMMVFLYVRCVLPGTSICREVFDYLSAVLAAMFAATASAQRRPSIAADTIPPA